MRESFVPLPGTYSAPYVQLVTKFSNTYPFGGQYAVVVILVAAMVLGKPVPPLSPSEKENLLRALAAARSDPAFNQRVLGYLPTEVTKLDSLLKGGPT